MGEPLERPVGSDPVCRAECPAAPVLVAETLGDAERAAITALVVRGRLKAEAANLGHAPPSARRRPRPATVAVGLGVWVLAGAGLVALIA